ncbi:DUF488 family protein [Streptococcus orisratti]
MKRLFTIGHSNFEFSYLVERLKKYEIDWVFDVRSVPHSAFAPQYNSENLSKELPKYDIDYYEMGEYFGARQLSREYRKCYPDGYLDFELWCKTIPYLKAKQGMLKRGIPKHNIALMCTEKNPIDCHRAIMITRDLELDGIESYHILGNGTLKTQSELSKDILNLYFSKKNHIKPINPEFNSQGTLDLFGDGKELIFEDSAYTRQPYDTQNNDEVDQLAEAYRERNKKIGYRIF